MKLFVIGNESPNPKDWNKWDEIAIVIAKDVNEAISLCSYGETRCCEIPMNRSMLVYQAPSPELWYGEET